MTDSSKQTPRADEDWKSRVQSEAAAESQDETPAADSPRDIDESRLPPANVTTLISMLSTQAMVSLGLIADPTTNKAEPRPALARHFIDMLGVVEEKTRGNLTTEEAQLLESALHELRMAFVHVSRK